MGISADGPAHSVLYEQRRWTWDEYEAIHLEFYPNGRGRAWWYVEHSHLLIVTLDWKVTASSEIDESQSPDTQARQLGKFDITVKLNREPCDAGPQNALNWLDRYYTPAAWEPKQFKITIEQGIFRAPCRAGKRTEDLPEATGTEQLAPGEYRPVCLSRWFSPATEDQSQRELYAYRVVFDQSPYPPPETWARPFHPQISGSYPESKVEFVARRLLRSKEERPAMNEAWQRDMVRVWEALPPSNPAFEEAMEWKDAQQQKANRLANRKKKREAKEQAKAEEARAQTGL